MWIWYNKEHMERIDDLQLKGLKIIQDTDLFCFGTDAVLLADFVKLKKNSRVADLGTGMGILPLLLFGRRQDITVKGLELQKVLYDLACRSVELNGLEANIEMINGDICSAAKLLGTGFDIVVSNPPYEKKTAGVGSECESHRIARFEVAVTLRGLCAAAGSLLQTGGRFYMIHRASRLAEIFEELKGCRLQPKEVRFIHSYVTSEPARVLLSAMKDGGEGLRILPPLIVHERDGSETEEVRRIYCRDGQQTGDGNGTG